MMMEAALQQQLAALAEKLGTTAERLWAVILVQQPINAVFDCLSFVGFLVLTVWWARIVWKKTTPQKGQEYVDWGDDPAVFFSWLSVVVLVFIAIYTIAASTPQWVAAFVNPEYAALRDLFSMMRK
jgi:hypothetical protein